MTIEGRSRNDWWVSNFTLEELNELKLVQERPERDASYDYLYGLPTFQDYVDVARGAERTIGLHVEIKSGLTIMFRSSRS